MCVKRTNLNNKRQIRYNKKRATHVNIRMKTSKSVSEKTQHMSRDSKHEIETCHRIYKHSKFTRTGALYSIFPYLT